MEQKSNTCTNISLSTVNDPEKLNENAGETENQRKNRNHLKSEDWCIEKTRYHTLVAPGGKS